MNTLQINKKLAKVGGYLGTFPYDELPRSKKKVFSLVVNTSSSHEPGTHWIAIVFINGTFYFLDSYGRNINDMTFSKPFKRVIKQYFDGKRYRYNTKLLQQFTSNTCGDYAIYFVLMLSCGFSLEKCIAVFTDNLIYNDVYVQSFVKHFK